MNRTAAGAWLEERIVSCLPAASFEMEALCRLAGIAESRSVSTAAIECRDRPWLLFNPEFIAEYCRTDEHLFLLVMHELWHLLLAHTRLYPRPSPAHNIAFDAIINAGLARQFPGPEYRGFFERINAADSFPALLLRPPVGWPAAPRYPRVGGPAATSLLRRLYPPVIGLQAELPLHQEVLELLLRDGGFPVNIVLLGDHDPEREARALADPLLTDALRRIVEYWPPPPFPLQGRDAGGRQSGWTCALGAAPDTVRRAFVQVLRRTLGPRPGGDHRRVRARLTGIGGYGVLPDGRDRLRPARQALQLPATLWRQHEPIVARMPDRPAQAHVYLDVSGSMDSVLPHLLGLLLPYVAAGQVRVFQFSTVVEPLSLASLRRGELRTTRGTEFSPVLEHALAAPHVRRLLVLTDGYVGPPREDLVIRLAERRLHVHAVLPAEGAWTDDLAPVAASITVLPPLCHSAAGGI